MREEFGDGVVSVINPRMDLRSEPKGDRMKTVIRGKFLSCKTYTNYHLHR